MVNVTPKTVVIPFELLMKLLGIPESSQAMFTPMVLRLLAPGQPAEPSTKVSTGSNSAFTGESSFGPIPTIGPVSITANQEEFPADWSDDEPPAAPQIGADPMAALLELAQDFSVLDNARFSVDVHPGLETNGKRQPLQLHIMAAASFSRPSSETV